MKRRIFKLVLVTCFILTVTALFTVNASAETYGDLSYTVSNGKVTITDCSTSATSVTIPSTIDGYPVTSIGDYAFYNCTSLTSIYYNAVNATDLGSLSSNNHIFSFAGQSGEGIKVTIGKDVEHIPAFLFCPYSSSSSMSYCPKITEVIFEEGSVCKSIGDYAFYNCTSLTSINIPDSVTSIGDYAFSRCTSLNYNLYNNAKYLGNANNPYHVLMDTSNTVIASIDIHPNTKIIGSEAFYNCTSLTSINIPEGVTSIGRSAFRECTSLTSINIPEGVTSIGHYAFYNCTRLTSINIPEGVTSIGYEAFYGCTRLTRVDITDIAAWCNISFSGSESNPLYYANNLYLNGVLVTDLTIPDSVTSIGSYAFYNCTRLTSITIPEGVTSIGNDAFYNCTSLTSIYYNAANATNLSSGNNVFSYAGRSGKGIKVTIGKDVEHIPAYLFSPSSYSSYCPKITEVIFEEGSVCKSIGGYAFYICTSLTSINIPESVMSIGNEAFNGCTSLASVYYCGTAEEWSKITINEYNGSLTEATLYYHKYISVVIVPADCVNEGIARDVCELCSDEKSTTTIPALGHCWGKWTEKVAPTCTKVGLEQRTCTLCEIKENKKVAAAHSFGIWYIVDDPTCTADGCESRFCSKCQTAETNVIPALGHNERTYAAKAPTCTDIGWDEYVACSRCGDNSTYVEIPALGHDYSEWEILVEPDENGDGFKSRICSRCNNEEYDYVHLATGDVDGDGKLTNTDVTLAIRALSGWDIDGDIALIDINYDGKYNNRDIIALIRKLAGFDLVYRIDPSNLESRTYVFCKKNITTKPEISCVSLHFEDEFSFDIYMTCESMYSPDEECTPEEHFTYNGIEFHPSGYGGEGGINASVSDGYIVINAFGNILKLEVLSNGTMRAVAPSDFYGISAGDIFR